MVSKNKKGFDYFRLLANITITAYVISWGKYLNTIDGVACAIFYLTASKNNGFGVSINARSVGKVEEILVSLMVE